MIGVRRHRGLDNPQTFGGTCLRWKISATIQCLRLPAGNLCSHVPDLGLGRLPMSRDRKVDVGMGNEGLRSDGLVGTAYIASIEYVSREHLLRVDRGNMGRIDHRRGTSCLNTSRTIWARVAGNSP
jgi:hypothetical protein